MFILLIQIDNIHTHKICSGQLFECLYVPKRTVSFKLLDLLALKGYWMRVLLKTMSWCIHYWFWEMFCDFFFGQNYNRDLFVFLYLLLIIVSAMTSLKKHNDRSAFTGKSILYLNRHQTEEWKGWMQASTILFIRIDA